MELQDLSGFLAHRVAKSSQPSAVLLVKSSAVCQVMLQTPVHMRTLNQGAGSQRGPSLDLQLTVTGASCAAGTPQALELLALILGVGSWVPSGVCRETCRQV